MQHVVAKDASSSIIVSILRIIRICAPLRCHVVCLARVKDCSCSSRCSCCGRINNRIINADCLHIAGTPFAFARVLLEQLRFGLTLVGPQTTEFVTQSCIPCQHHRQAAYPSSTSKQTTCLRRTLGLGTRMIMRALGLEINGISRTSPEVGHGITTMSTTGLYFQPTIAIPTKIRERGVK